MLSRGISKVFVSLGYNQEYCLAPETISAVHDMVVDLIQMLVRTARHAASATDTSSKGPFKLCKVDVNAKINKWAKDGAVQCLASLPPEKHLSVALAVPAELPLDGEAPSVYAPRPLDADDIIRASKIALPLYAQKYLEKEMTKAEVKFQTAIDKFEKATALVVEDSQTEDNTNSLVYLSAAKMSELGLYQGSSVLVRGGSGRETVCTVISIAANKSVSVANANPSANAVRLPVMVRKNCGAELGETVSVVPKHDLPQCKSIVVVPVDTVITGDASAATLSRLRDTYLKPHFTEFCRPVHVGDCFTLGHTSAGRVEFRVVGVELKQGGAAKLSQPCGMCESDCEIRCVAEGKGPAIDSGDRNTGVETSCEPSPKGGNDGEGIPTECCGLALMPELVALIVQLVEGYGGSLTADGAVVLTAAAECLVQELLEIAVQFAGDSIQGVSHRHRRTIEPRHLSLAIYNDEELSNLYPGHVMHGGVQPEILFSSLPSTRALHKDPARGHSAEHYQALQRVEAFMESTALQGDRNGDTKVSVDPRDGNFYMSDTKGKWHPAPLFDLVSGGDAKTRRRAAVSAMEVRECGGTKLLHAALLHPYSAWERRVEEVKKQQQATGLCFCADGFAEWVQECCKKVKVDCLITQEAARALQHAVEAYIIQLLRDANTCAMLAKRRFLEAGDIQAAERLHTKMQSDL